MKGLDSPVEPGNDGLGTGFPGPWPRLGICVEPENTEALKDAVIRLYKDKNLRETLGSNGRSYIVDYLSRKSTAEIYIKVLESVVADWKEKRDSR